MALAALKHQDELLALLADCEPRQYDILERFVDHSPHKPYCTDEKGTALLIRQRHSAFKKKRVQHNPPSMTSWLTFDIDHGNSLIFKDVTLPAPNVIVMTKDTGHSHMSYAIESVCTSDAARPKPMRYLSAIQDAYCELLQADVSYTNFITKNPLHPEWDLTVYHSREYSLGELADYVDLKVSRPSRKRAANDAVHGVGRNCAQFDRLRFWAYDHVTWHRESGTTYDQWMREVLSKSEGFNTYPEPLPYSEVKSTGKSVGKWVWMEYWPKGKTIRRGTMASSFQQSQLPLDLTTKQRLSARRTAEIKRSNTEEKIIDAIGVLTGQGKKVTKTAVAKLVGVSQQNISKHYKHLFIA